MRHAHAIERAWERYGLELTESDFEDVVAEIKRGHSLLQGTVDRGLERRIVKIKGKMVPVVFAPDVGYIVTVMPNFKMRRSA
jgi:hypothetical protein